MPGDGKTIDLKMIRILIIILFFSFSVDSFAQKPDSLLATRYRPGLLWFYGGLKPSKLTDARKYDRVIIDLVHSDWMSENTKPFTNHWASIGFNTQFIFDIPLTKRNIISLGMGLGFGHSKIRSTQVLTNFSNLEEPIEEMQLVSQASIPNLKKSIFKTNVLFVPVELRFRTPGWQHFKFQVGGRVGVQMGPKTKNYYEINGESSLVKRKGFQDINRFLLSVHTRVGIRNWAITASYNVTPYFSASEKNQINGLEVGLSVSLF